MNLILFSLICITAVCVAVVVVLGVLYHRQILHAKDRGLPSLIFCTALGVGITTATSIVLILIFTHLFQ